MTKKDRDRDNIFSVFTDDERGCRTLDLVRLSDIFSRAGSAAFDEDGLAYVFNAKAEKLARDVAAAIEGVRGDRDIAGSVRKLVMLARDNGAARLVLPVAAGSDAARYLERNVLLGQSFSRFYNVAIDFKPESYQSPAEIQALGAVRPEVRTALDYGFWRKSEPLPVPA